MQPEAGAQQIVADAFNRRMSTSAEPSSFWSLADAACSELHEERTLFLALWDGHVRDTNLAADLFTKIHDVYLAMADCSQSTSQEKEFQARLWATLAFAALHELLASGKPFDARWLLGQIEEMLETVAGSTDV